jgi:PAS domain S-box-containing protein
MPSVGKHTMMGTALQHPADEIQRLRGCVNDLVRVLALPTAWAGGDPSRIARTLLDALLGMLRADFIYARLSQPGDPEHSEMACFASPAQAMTPEDLGAALARSLGDTQSRWPAGAPVRVGASDCLVAMAPLGPHGEFGLVVAGSRQPDFPTQTGRLVLDVAASQATIALQEARRLTEERRTVLREAEADASRIVGHIPGIVLFFMTPDGEHEIVSPQLTRYFGKTIEELRHWMTDDTVHPDDRPQAIEIFRRAIASGEPYKFEARFRRADGIYHWFQCRGLPRRDEAGRIVRWSCVGIDIDERKRAEMLLAGERQLLEMVASRRPIPEILEALCRLVEDIASGSYCSLVLVDASGTTFRQAIAPSLPPEFNETVRGWPLARRGGPCVMAARDRTQVIMSDVASDTRWRDSWRALAQSHGLRSCWSTPIVSQAGTVLGTFALYRREPGSPSQLQLDLIRQFTNIASIAIERAQGDEALRRSEARLAAAERDLKQMIDTIPAYVSAYEPDGTRSFVNRTWQEYMGLTLEQATAADPKSFPHFHPDDAERNDEAWQASLARGEPLAIEVRVRRADGQYRWHISRRTPLRDEQDRIVKWYSIGIDIDDQKRAEDALRQSEARLIKAERELQLMIDTVPAFVTVFRPDGERESVNKTWRDNTGLQLADIQHGSWTRIVHPDDQERSERLWREALASGEPLLIEQRIRRHDGQYRWHMGRRAPLRDDSGNILRWYSVAVDVEDQKRAEEMLRASEVNLRKIIDMIPALAWVASTEGVTEFCNKHYIDYTGFSVDRLPQWLKLALHPDDFAQFMRRWQAIRASGQPEELEARLRRHDGDYRWFLFRAAPLRDNDGNILKWYGINTDIEDRKRAEQALRQSEAQLSEAQRELQLTIDSIPVLVASYRPDGTRAFVNQTWRSYTGLTLAQATGEVSTAFPHFHPDDAEPIEHAILASLASGEPLPYQVRLRNADGAYRWHSVRRVPLRDENGAIIRWYSTGFDIQDQKVAEARLAETERELRVTLDSIPTITWRAAPNGYVQQLNRRWFDYTGTTPEEVRGWRWKLCVHPDDLERLVAIGSDYVSSGVPIDGEARLRRHDGVYRWFLFRPAPARDETGKIVAWYGSITDIEDRKSAEQALQQSEARLAAAERELQLTIDTIPTLVATYRPDGSRIFVNRTWREYTGHSLETAMQAPRVSFVHPDDAERVGREWDDALAAGVPLKTEARLRRADGAYRWHAIHRVLARDEMGEIIKWYSVAADIEDRKRAEEKVAEAERELRLTLDSIPTMTWRGAPNGHVQQINKSFFDYTGTTPEEMQGGRWQSCVHPDDLPGLRAVGRTLGPAGIATDAEARLRRQDGEYRWFLFRPAASRDASGQVSGWYGIITDIEDRKRAEEALRRSETLLAEGQRLSATGTLSWHVDTNVATFSQELNRIFEFEPNIFVTLGRLRARIHPDDRALMDEAITAVRAGREVSELDIRLRMEDGRIKYLRILGRVIRRQDGGPELLGAIQDVTQRRAAEAALDNVRSELGHVTRAMSLGALTASIAHEVNQPLAGIITNASTCLRMLAADPPNVEGARETARRTIRDGNRAADVITRLRALFSKKAAASETVDVSEAAREVLALVSGDLLRSRVTLRAELTSEPLLVTGDRVQLQQVILNLVRNASDAMSGVHERPRHLLIRASDDGDMARLVVRDAGIGFDSEAAGRLFDAFYTTKSDGMGIGLSVSRSIIESHGGRLWAEPNDGPGATFSFSIPRQAPNAGDEGTVGAVSPRPTRGVHDAARNA